MKVKDLIIKLLEYDLCNEVIFEVNIYSANLIDERGKTVAHVYGKIEGLRAQKQLDFSTKVVISSKSDEYTY